MNATSWLMDKDITGFSNRRLYDFYTEAIMFLAIPGDEARIINEHLQVGAFLSATNIFAPGVGNVKYSILFNADEKDSITGVQIISDKQPAITRYHARVEIAMLLAFVEWRYINKDYMTKLQHRKQMTDDIHSIKTITDSSLLPVKHPTTAQIKVLGWSRIILGLALGLMLSVIYILTDYKLSNNYIIIHSKQCSVKQLQYNIHGLVPK